VRCGPIQEEGGRAAVLTINGGHRHRLDQIRHGRRTGGRGGEGKGVVLSCRVKRGAGKENGEGGLG
jgi:hypothetical protein